jgi:hypothetical protein
MITDFESLMADPLLGSIFVAALFALQEPVFALDWWWSEMKPLLIPCPQRFH